MDFSDITLIVLDPVAQKIFTCDGDGRVIATLHEGVATTPDGIVLDPAHGHLYGTLMGRVDLKDHTAYDVDGAIMRMNLDGSDVVPIVPSGGTRTPKQITLDQVNGKLYWGDREGLCVMRCDRDGTALETIYLSGDLPEDERDETKWCVGVAVDPLRRLIYFGLKGHPDAGEGKICCIGYDLPKGETAGSRSDFRVILAGLPEPIDLELHDGYLFWTDRGDLTGGNSLSKVRLDEQGNAAGPVELIADGLRETIGLALCPDKGVAYATSLTGELYRVQLDGSGATEIGKFGGLTGLARLP